MKVNIINKSKYENPSYKTEGSAGMDLLANIDQEIVIKSLDRIIIPTGLFIELPNGYEAQIRSRSGMTIKHGLVVANGIGTIDSDYRGEIGVIMLNISKEDYTIKPGERIAQMVIAKYEQVDLISVDVLSDSERGQGGFGSTGK